MIIGKFLNFKDNTFREAFGRIQKKTLNLPSFSCIKAETRFQDSWKIVSAFGKLLPRAKEKKLETYK